MFKRETQELIQTEYEKLREILPERFDEIEKELEQCSPKETTLLKYLYGNMPISDAVSYPFATFLSYAEHGVMLWEEGAFSKKIPEELFLPYVVYHRVNTEDICPCRSFFLDQTRGLLQEESMEETVKALNYWCAAQASYRASDDRTASPLTVFHSGYGRCGEESVFTVSVLRSAGIPARQIYVPRWSHCDDNHAWVEVWCDGIWKFLGACEPEEILNRGWFTSASSRAMITHTRFFGEFPVEKEEIIEKDVFVKELNQLERYGETEKVRVKVRDSRGIPVEQADVFVEVLNYSRFIKVARQQTDETGSCTFTLGKGSVRIYGEKDGKEASLLVNCKEQQEITLVLEESLPDYDWKNFVVLAPADSEKNVMVLTKDQKQKGREGMAEAAARRMARKRESDEQKYEKWMVHPEEERWKKALWDTLSLKDHLDFSPDVLQEHLEESMPYAGSCPFPVFQEGILAPRISTEMLTPYKRKIREFFGREQRESFRKRPETIWTYVEEQIRSTDREYHAIVTTPWECLKYRMGNRESKDLLFVAICRSLGIPARLSAQDGTKEYYQNGQFCKVQEEQVPSGQVKLTFAKDGPWIYEENFSIVRKDGPVDTVIHMEGGRDGRETEQLLLAPGSYEIVVQNRLPNGNIYGRATRFTLKKGEERSLYLEKQQARVEDMLEHIPLPLFTLKDQQGREVPSSHLLPGKKQLLLWLEVGQEPTEHILNEMTERAEEFSRIGSSIALIVKDRKDFQNRTVERLVRAMPELDTYTSCVEEDCNLLGRRMYVDPERLPLILVTDSQGRGIYAASGYRVGMAELLLKILKL